MTSTPKIPRKGELYSMNGSEYMGRPMPCAVIADGLFRWRDKTTRRRPERFVQAGARAGRGESLELYTPVLYELDSQHFSRESVEAVAGRLSELAAVFDMAILDSAATQWGAGHDGAYYDVRPRRASVSLGEGRYHVIFIAFDAKLREWTSALAAYDAKVAELAERDALRKEAERKNEENFDALRRFAKACGLRPTHQHIMHMGGDQFNRRLTLSPELVDALIAGGKL